MADQDTYQHGSVDDAPVVEVVVPPGTHAVRIVNRSGAAELAATGNGVTPSLTGNNLVLPASVGASDVIQMEDNHTTVKLIAGPAGVTYSVWVVS